MKIYLEKFGNLLISRQTGREAFLALQSQLKDLQADEGLELDFSGNITFSPSWGDEFLTPLLAEYGSRLLLTNTENLSVKTTIEFLEDIHKIHFNRTS